MAATEGERPLTTKTQCVPNDNESLAVVEDSHGLRNQLDVVICQEHTARSKYFYVSRAPQDNKPQFVYDVMRFLRDVYWIGTKDLVDAPAVGTRRAFQRFVRLINRK